MQPKSFKIQGFAIGHDTVAYENCRFAQISLWEHGDPWVSHEEAEMNPNGLYRSKN